MEMQKYAFELLRRELVSDVGPGFNIRPIRHAAILSRRTVPTPAEARDVTVRMTIACQVVGTPEQHAAKCYFDCLDALRKEWVRCVETPKE
jgi:hypothetical protein